MMREGADGEREPFRFAMHSQPKGGHPAFVLKSGERLANPEDLTDLGFQFLVLHECSFSYNIRRLETMLHTHFWDHRNRLWRARGAGSYYVSDRHLKVCCCCCVCCFRCCRRCCCTLLLLTHLQSQQDNARISKLFITYSPTALCEQLSHNCASPILYHCTYRTRTYMRKDTYIHAYTSE